MRVWDVSTGEEKHVLRSDQESVSNILFSPDGQLIASAGSDQSVRLWDMTTAAESIVLTTAGKAIYSLAFNPAGTLLAAFTDTNQIHIWNVATGQEQAVLTDERFSRWDKPLFSSDGQYLVIGSHGRVNGSWTVDADLNISRIENIEVSTLNSALVKLLGIHPGSVASGGLTVEPQMGIEWFGLQSRSSDMEEDVVVSPDGRKAIANFLNRWEIFDLASPPTSSVLRTVTDSIDKVALSSDNDMALITTAYEGFAWRPFEGRSRSVSIQNTGRYIPEMLFIQSRPVIIANSWEGASALVDAETGESLQEFEDFSGSTESWDIDPDKELLVINNRRSATHLIDIKIGHEIASISPNDSERGYSGATFSSDGTQIAMAGYDADCDCTISLLWNGSTTTVLGPFQGFIHSFAFSPDDQLLAVGGSIPTAEGFGGKVQIWDLQTRSEKGIYTGPPHTVDTLLFNPNSHYVAGSGFDRSVWLWDIDKRDTAMITLKSETDYRDYKGMAFSPDGRLLAVGTWQGDILLFDVATSTELTRLVGHKAAITDIVFSANGTMLLSGSYDGTARLWGINPPPIVEPIQNLDNSMAMPIATLTPYPNDLVVIPMAALTPSPTWTRAPTRSFSPSISPTPTRVP